MSESLNTVLASYLQAAESDGRPLSDPEAHLIETLATMPPAAVVDVEAREALASLQTRVAESLPAAHAPDTVHATSGLLPDTAGLNAMLQAVRSRQPFSVTAAAAHYDTHIMVGEPIREISRLVDFMRSVGAVNAGMARNLEVPVIASGDAAVWTTGSKAEIVTELATIPATVCAAWTEVTSTGFLDFQNLQTQLGRLLGRRVVLQENLAVASDLESQGTAAANGADAVATVTGALVQASESGGIPNLLLLASDLATDVLAAAQAGFAGLDTYWRGSLFGVRYVIVPGLTASTAIAADCSAIAIGRSDVLQLVDPYSASKTNGVILRTEVSVATAVLDPYAVGVCVTAAP